MTRVYDTRTQGVPYPHEIPFTELYEQKIDEIYSSTAFMPTGGNPGDVLRKLTGEDYSYYWANMQSYDGTLDATGQAANAVPRADGNGNWSWQVINPVITWADVQGKPTMGDIISHDSAEYAVAGHTHSASQTVSGVFDLDRIPAKLVKLNNATISTAAPSGGADGDWWFKVV